VETSFLLINMRDWPILFFILILGLKGLKEASS